MQQAILALFAEHGPMTLAEAMPKGLSIICNTTENNNARYHLTKLVASGELSGRYARLTVPCSKAGETRQAKVFIYKVKS
ncbi:MAG: hypothetical protein ACRC8Q_04200 [Aeromonas sp.]